MNVHPRHKPLYRKDRQSALAKKWFLLSHEEQLIILKPVMMLLNLNEMSLCHKFYFFYTDIIYIPFDLS